MVRFVYILKLTGATVARRFLGTFNPLHQKSWLLSCKYPGALPEKNDISWENLPSNPSFLLITSPLLTERADLYWSIPILICAKKGGTAFLVRIWRIGVRSMQLYTRRLLLHSLTYSVFLSGLQVWESSSLRFTSNICHESLALLSKEWMLYKGYL